MDSLIVRADMRGLVRTASGAVRAEVVREKPASLRPPAIGLAVAPQPVIDVPADPQPTAAGEPARGVPAADETSYQPSRLRGVAAYAQQLRAADDRLLGRGVVIRRSA